MSAKIYKDAEGKRLPSVTTIIGRFKDSGALLYWANNAGLEGKTLDQARIPAATAGTMAHNLVEAHLNKRPLPELEGDADVIAKARRAFDAYLSWSDMTKLQVRHTEVSLASGKHKFGGTLDAIGVINGSNGLALIDWKTSNSIYPDYLYQLAAYKLLWEENYPDHPITGGAHLCRFAKEEGDYAHHHFPNVDEEAATFLAMRELYDRVKKTEKRVK
jgi:PD-(D/E)XK nuclease superfamily